MTESYSNNIHHRNTVGDKLYKPCGYTMCIQYDSVFRQTPQSCHSLASDAPVTRFAAQTENMQHKLYTDKFLSSSVLFDNFHAKRVNCCETVRLNRKRMPKSYERVISRQTDLEMDKELIFPLSWPHHLQQIYQSYLLWFKIITPMTHTCIIQGPKTRCRKSVWTSGHMTCLISTIHQSIKQSSHYNKMATGTEENLALHVFCQK